MTEPGPRYADREARRGDLPRPRPAHPVYELTVDAVRTLDRLAVERFGVPGIVLMENAARNLREHALDLLARARSDETVILCGPGNNGGDGLALARHLSNLGVPVSVVLAGRPEDPGNDAGINLTIAERMGIPSIEPALLPEDPGSTPGLVVDALFGTGLTRPIEGVGAGLIAWATRARSSGALVLAVDVPSGLDAQSGEPLGEACVRADRTVTLAAVKPGLTRLEAQEFVGDLAVADIGAPAILLGELGRVWLGRPGSPTPESGV